jgi:hypothetical protein
MTEDELNQIKAMIEAVNSHHEQESLVNPEHCRLRWRRRMAVMVVVIGGMYVAGEVLHYEALVKGWEFLGACIVDKLIFGISEA